MNTNLPTLAPSSRATSHAPSTSARLHGWTGEMGKESNVSKTRTTPTLVGGVEIKKIDRNTAREIAAAVVAQLATFAEDHGLEITQKGGSFSDVEYTAKFSFKVRNTASGESADEATFKKYAHGYNLKPEDFGAAFKCNGHTFTICGLKITARSKPILAMREDGGRYRFDEFTINRLMGRVSPDFAALVGGAK